ncbi:MAG: murein hydrolase activator EnvC family protein [Halothiobacillaceae bacterium]
MRAGGPVLALLIAVLPFTVVKAEPSIDDRIERQSHELASIGERVEALRARVESAEREMTTVNERIEALSAERARLVARQEALRADRSALAARVDALSESLKDHLQVAYRLGDRGVIELLLGDSDPLDTQRDLLYLRYLIAPIRAELAGWQTARAELAEVEAAIEEQSRQLAETTGRLEARKKSLEAASARRSAGVSELEEQLADGQARLADLRNRKARMEAELARIEAEPEPRVEAPAPQGPAGPVDENGIPVLAKVLRGYGAALGVGDLKSEGLFFETQRGMPVRAVAQGQVVFADWMSGLGQMVILRHSGGYLSLYAHNIRLRVAEGDRVQRGQILAESGRTAGRAEPGLYFEVRKGNRPVDPASWKPFRESRAGAG